MRRRDDRRERGQRLETDQRASFNRALPCGVCSRADGGTPRRSRHAEKSGTGQAASRIRGHSRRRSDPRVARETFDVAGNRDHDRHARSRRVRAPARARRRAADRTARRRSARVRPRCSGRWKRSRATASTGLQAARSPPRRDAAPRSRRRRNRRRRRRASPASRSAKAPAPQKRSATRRAPVNAPRRRAPRAPSSPAIVACRKPPAGKRRRAPRRTATSGGRRSISVAP